MLVLEKIKDGAIFGRNRIKLSNLRRFLEVVFFEFYRAKPAILLFSTTCCPRMKLVLNGR